MHSPRWSRAILVALLAFIEATSGCVPATDRSPGGIASSTDTAPALASSTDTAPVRIRPQIVITEVADTTIVRSEGVPTDPDDTIGTQYQKHEAPRRILAPECLPSGIALCIADTARSFRSGDVEEGDGGVADARLTPWLVFATTGDSIQLFIVSSTSSYITMTPRSATGFGAEHAQGVDASWIRPRFPDAGAYILTARIESDSAIAYELRVVPVIATGASRPIGASATVTLSGDSSMRVGLLPAAMARGLDPAGFEKFAVRAGSYRVLLVRDTSYVACRLPCANRQLFTMHVGQAVTIAP